MRDYLYSKGAFELNEVDLMLEALEQAWENVMGRAESVADPQAARYRLAGYVIDAARCGHRTALAISETAVQRFSGGWNGSEPN